MLISTLTEHANQAPSETAFFVNDKALTWTALYHQTMRFVEQLKKFESKRIMISISGSSEMDIALILACSDLKMESVFLSTFHSAERSDELLKEFDGEFIVSGASGEIEVVRERSTDNDRTPIETAQVCLLTSGTTGSPKCVRYSWARLARAVVTNPKFKGRRWFMSYHLTNFAGTQVFLQSFMNRGCMVIPKGWPPDSRSHHAALHEYGIQYLNCTATYARKLLLSAGLENYDSLKTITLGGEVVDQSLIDALKMKFRNARVIHIYASTELGANIEVKDEREGFSADLLDGERLKIVEGELLVRKSNRSMIGYLKNAGTNTGTICNKDDDWFETGDLVEKKSDRVVFLGRRDSMINVGGFKVNPTTVETVVRKASGVREVVATGQKNPITGQLLKLTLVLNVGADREEVKQEILKICAAHLPYYSVPRLFDFRESIELTSSFKIKR